MKVSSYYVYLRSIDIYTSYYLRNLITKVLYFPNQVVLKLFSGSVVTCNWRTQPLSSASNLCNYVQSVMRQTRCDMPQIKEASECTNQEVLSQPGFPDPVFTGSSQVTSIAAADAPMFMFSGGRQKTYAAKTRAFAW